MDDYLFVARSITQAQRMSRVLEQCGIRTSMLRAPVGLTDRGCSYAVRIRGEQFDTARQCLRTAALQPFHIFHREEGVYREVGQ
ncbi:MAG: DUF3343 domain-containing protein [Clostridiales bacterium]|nr:DUF3343 domain-containing protein [Candidatus Cacconaster stercorequi]